MVNIKKTVLGTEVDIDKVTPEIRRLCITIAFGTSNTTPGWWNHIPLATQILYDLEGQGWSRSDERLPDN